MSNSEERHNVRNLRNEHLREYIDNADALGNVNQFGDYAINVGVLHGGINVFLPENQSNPDFFAKSLRHLSNLRHSLPTLTPVITRVDKQQEIYNWIKKPSDSKRPKRVGFITGRPGVGKTAFTNMLYHNLSKKDNYLVFGLKVDQIEFQNIEDISKQAVFNRPLSWIIDDIKDKYERVVVIIDQIDALSLSLSSDRTPLNSVVKFIRDLNDIKGVRVLVSCRDYDIDYDPILSELCVYNQRWRLGDFSRNEVVDVLTANNRKTELSEALLNFLGNPLNLSLYLKIGETDYTISPLNINTLYDEVWKQDILAYESKSKEKLDLIALINELSESMHNSQRISESVVRYESRFHKELQYLVSCGFLKKEGNFLQFSHQTLFDYVYARRFVETDKSIIDELNRHHQGLFIRSQIHSVLLFLRSHDPVNYILTLKNILSEKNSIKYHIKVLALTLLAYQDSPLDSEIKLLRNKIWDNDQYAYVFLNAINSKIWFEEVLSLMNSRQGWVKGNPRYQETIIGSALHAVDLQFDWAIDILKEIILHCDSEYRSNVLAQLQNRNLILDANSLKAFYLFLKEFDKDRFYPKMLENLTAFDPNLVSSEIINYVNLLLKESGTDFSYRFSIGYEWGKVFSNLESQNPDETLDLVIQLIRIISEATRYDFQLYEIKSCSAYNSFRKISGGDISHHSTDYLYTYVINSLVAKIKGGIDVKPKLRDLLSSGHAPLVCAALNVLLETCNDADDLVFEVVSGKRFLTDSPPWVQYYSIELLKVAFKYFDEEQRKRIVDNILSFETKFDKFNTKLDASIRMENGIPISYHSWDIGVLLNAIPENLLKETSEDAWHEWQRLNRRFKHLDNDMPSKTETMIGWQSMPKEVGSKMGEIEWKNAMKKYKTDIFHDFTTPTLSGQCSLFKQEVFEHPDKFTKLIMDIFDDEDISMRYVIAGIEGLIAGGRLNDAAEIIEKLFNQWLASDINRSERDFSLHGYLFAISNVFNSDEIPPIIFDTIRRIVLEADDAKDMDRFSGSDILTYAINTTRGNATERLVLCEKYPQYRDGIFEVLEIIAPTANVSTRAAALINLALLDNIDKDRNLGLFKLLLHDYNPLLMSMPLHNLNPLVYFVRDAFDQLTDYFEKVIEIPESHKTQVNVLWLAHIYKHGKAMDFIKRIQSINPDAMASLVSFLSQQNCYDKESIEFITGLIQEIPSSSDLASAVDNYLYRFPIKKIEESISELEDLLLYLPATVLIKSSHFGYLDLLKHLSVTNPQLTLKSLYLFIDRITEGDSYRLNEIVEILINSYNTIRKYNDPDDEDILERAIDYMDTLLMQASGPSYLNNYINHIDNG